MSVSPQEDQYFLSGAVGEQSNSRRRLHGQRSYSRGVSEEPAMHGLNEWMGLYRRLRSPPTSSRHRESPVQDIGHAPLDSLHRGDGPMSRDARECRPVAPLAKNARWADSALPIRGDFASASIDDTDGAPRRAHIREPVRAQAPYVLSASHSAGSWFAICSRRTHPHSTFIQPFSRENVCAAELE